MAEETKLKLRRVLKKKWTKRYFDQVWLSNAKWLRSELERGNNKKKTNGARTLFQKILGYHKKKGNYEEGQEVIKILASQKPEVDELKKEIGNIGCAELMNEKWNLEMDSVAITCEDGMYREVILCFSENDDEGCYAGELILVKEQERLAKAWKKK